MSRKMHPNTPAKHPLHTLKALGVAVASALVMLSGSVDAAGLGQLTVLSSLGQPLRAEIAMTSVSRDEAGGLTAKLASMAAFRDANVEFGPALKSLRFAIEHRASGSVIRVTSTQPINEPFIDMLLELSSSKSHLVREYTFLLDPADLRMTQPAQMAAPSAVAVPRTNVAASTVSVPPAASSSRSTRTTPVAERNLDSEAAARKKVDEYHVKKGDSLAGIARQLKPAGVSLDQMLIALYRHNPDAFVGQNMNRMRAGRILSVPAATEVAAIVPSEARSNVVAQTKDFNQYRNRLAGQVADSAASKSVATSQSASGKITSTVEESSTAAASSKDQLKLSRAGAGDVKETGAGSAASTGAAAHTEDLIARDKALAEANARVSSLEKSVADLQKLLELKNSSLGQAQAGHAAAAVAATPAVAAAATEAKPENPPTATDVAAVTNTASETPVAAAAAEPAPTVAPIVAAPAKVAVKTPPPVSAAEPSFVESLAQNTLLLPGMGLLLVALGAFGIYNSRRKKKQKQFTDSLLADSSLKANSLFGSTGGQSVDTNNSVFNSSLQPSAGQLDTNEVDPIAEADVYIAYGRDAQAEEILKEALRTQPERNAVRVKLLEIYANRRDLRAFELQAGELYSMTKGAGDEWTQAASLGRSIDASNPLYAGGKLDGAVIDKVASITAPTEPLDELDLDALLATTQPHSLLESDELQTNSAQQLADLSAESDTVTASQPHADTADRAAKASAVNDLDFDLGDFGAEIQSVQPAPVQAADTESSSASTPAVTAMDFGTIDFDLNSADTAADVDAAVEKPIDSIADATVVPAMEFHSTTPDVALAPTESLETSLHLRDVAEHSETPVQTVQAPTSATTSTLREFDLSAINLDLGEPDPTAADSDSDADPYAAEMSTKLDLALAYREIGDKEGARELLDEVVKDGSTAQAERARSILLELA